VARERIRDRPSLRDERRRRRDKSSAKSQSGSLHPASGSVRLRSSVSYSSSVFTVGGRGVDLQICEPVTGRELTAFQSRHSFSLSISVAAARNRSRIAR
jgi:hypothetical protein